jgi:hypothetical protein
MAAVVLLTTRAPSKLTDDLALAGHRAWECLSVSEALYLCENENVDVIVIAPDIEDPDLAEAQLHYVTIRMKPEATAMELIWELSKLFDSGSVSVQ